MQGSKAQQHATCLALNFMPRTAWEKADRNQAEISDAGVCVALCFVHIRGGHPTCQQSCPILQFSPLFSQAVTVMLVLTWEQLSLTDLCFLRATSVC